MSFPAEYRAHLPAGSPGRAVFRPCRSAAGRTFGGALPTRIDLLAEPFPHPDSFAEADLALDAREPWPEDFAEERSHLPAWRAWDLEREEREDRKTAGAGPGPTPAPPHAGSAGPSGGRSGAGAGAGG
ncbi:hypothetical protein ACIRP0_26495 [Streptomyces sp. NPDC101733]|uniref:hypothetical protein n=1 Tax=unclassified Streptomyces TaxID=2593676 RepID=UPI0037FA0F92